MWRFLWRRFIAKIGGMAEKPETSNSVGRGGPSIFGSNNESFDVSLVKEPAKEEREAFAEQVRKMRESSHACHNYNSQSWQSKIIVNELFNYASDHPCDIIRLFLGDVKCEFYKTLIVSKVKELASNGQAFEIILAEPPGGDITVWKELSSLSRVTVKMKPQYDETLGHFMLFGDSYRVETPHKKYDGPVTDVTPLRCARFGFHDTAIATMLRYMWDTMIKPETKELLAS